MGCREVGPEYEFDWITAGYPGAGLAPRAFSFLAFRSTLQNYHPTPKSDRSVDIASVIVTLMLTCRVLPRFILDPRPNLPTLAPHLFGRPLTYKEGAEQILSFLSLAHSFSPWSSGNPFPFNSLRTLSIAMGVYTPMADHSRSARRLLGGHSCGGRSSHAIPIAAVAPVVVPLEPRCFPTGNALYLLSPHIVTALFFSQRGVHPPPCLTSFCLLTFFLLQSPPQGEFPNVRQ